MGMNECIYSYGFMIFFSIGFVLTLFWIKSGIQELLVIRRMLGEGVYLGEIFFAIFLPFLALIAGTIIWPISCIIMSIVMVIFILGTLSDIQVFGPKKDRQ